MRQPTAPRHGHTLAETAIVLAVAGLVLVAVVPGARRMRDRVAVHAALREVAAAHATARSAAIARGRWASVLLDEATGALVVRAGDDTVLHRNPLRGHGVRLTSTRDSSSYAPTGLGWGAANTSVVARRGAAADTLWVSRLGRVRL